jgi:L-2-amino-thiazoline-4-carboxylic acid hydrolase
MNEETREELLSRELEDAFRGRAHLYRVILEELTASMGEVAAEQLLARAIERRGREVAAGLFKAVSPPSANAIGEKFLSVSPDRGRMYPCQVERRSDGMSIRVDRCPLQDAWVDSGQSSEQVATLCRIAGAFDKGLFEAAGVKFANQPWHRDRGGGCCWIHLKD